MSINWFPGHMHKARKEIAEVMPQVDIIIEMLDARIPFSSENPLVPQLRKDTPCIKVLNKADLADPALTARWVDYFAEQKKCPRHPDQPTATRTNQSPAGALQ